MKKLIAGMLIIFMCGANPAAVAASTINTKTPLQQNEVVQLQAMDEGQLDDVAAGRRARGGVLLAVIIVAAAVAVLASD